MVFQHPVIVVSLFNSIRFDPRLERWASLISCSASHCMDPILHFCHFWALESPWRLLSPNQFAIGSALLLASLLCCGHYYPGEIIILMTVLASLSLTLLATQCPRKWPKITCIAQCAFLPILIAYQVIKAAKFWGKRSASSSALMRRELQDAMHFFCHSKHMTSFMILFFHSLRLREELFVPYL